MTTRTLYRPPDVEAARRDWRASCGPCAVAALLGRTLAATRPLFPDFPGWATPTAVRAALTRAGVRHRVVRGTAFPDRGLVFVQLTGPWDAPGVPVGAAYRRTHWVAVKLVGDGTDSGESDEWVYDVNADAEDGGRGDWWPRDQWAALVMPAVVAGCRGATGWRVRLGVELLAPDPAAGRGEGGR